MKTNSIMCVVSLMAMALIAQCSTNSGNGGPASGGANGGGNTNGGGINGDAVNVGDISSLTSMELTHQMTVGWNLGNTLDAHWNARPWGTMQTPRQQETLWGNPATTKAMIDAVKESGFNTIRIPVTWYLFTGPAPEYKVADAWMDRVQEVVDYVIGNGMFCILNTHHEEYQIGSDWELGWLRLYHADGNASRPLSAGEKEAVRAHVSGLWKQIAERFKDYDERLIFEALNEPRTKDFEEPYTRAVWEEQNAFLNELLQTFVDTVRSGGGKNTARHLMVTPYFASVGMNAFDRDGRIADFIDRGAKKLKVNDPQNRLIASLHYYEPWGFTTAPADSQWFTSTFDLNKAVVSSNIGNVLKIIGDNFIVNGIPVIMGETGAIRRDIDGHEAERVKWAEYYTARLKELGVPVVIWDDGGGFKLLDRSVPQWAYPDLAAALVAGAKAGKK